MHRISLKNTCHKHYYGINLSIKRLACIISRFKGTDIFVAILKFQSFQKDQHMPAVIRSILCLLRIVIPCTPVQTKIKILLKHVNRNNNKTKQIICMPAKSTILQVCSLKLLLPVKKRDKPYNQNRNNIRYYFVNWLLFWLQKF